MILEPTITPIIPDTFEYQTYSNSDENLIVQSELDTVFSSSTDYIEYYIYDQNKDLIYPSQTVSLLDYDVRKGDVLLNPSSNLKVLGFDIGVYNISYSFYRKRASSSITENYFISDISSDRTEIRLDSNVIENSDIISSVNDFIQYRETSTYFVDFYLNFGQNQTIIANNIKLETEEGVDPTVLIKLYEPLPLEFSNKSELWIVELLSSPQAYKVDFPFEPTIEDDFIYIAGPNYNLNIIGETASPGEQFSYNTLINSDVTSSINQIQSLLNEKEININIDYEKFSNFINFSSAKTRLENFFYKVDLIQSSSNQLTSLSTQVTTDTTTTLAYSSSAASLTGAIDTIIKNFDGYEYFLYFNSGSTTSYPKSNTEPPFILYPTSNSEVQTWITSSLALATDYDDNNRDWLYNSIPEYLRDDPANRNYELFVDMVGQYYDNVWTYTKDITNKFDADNRLDYGISKDLVSDAIKDFAVKLYSNNFNTDDLFTAFLGLTPSGSAFPFPNITGSLPTPSGFEYVDTKISASNDIVPLDDVNKSVYKRIYHNIPYLLKTKGTIAGLRALITSYGIPDTILRISEFGGKDRNESQDYDLKQDVFNYTFDTGVNATNYVSSSLQANPTFPVQSGTNKARSIQLRFKSPTLPLPVNNIASSNIRYSQSIFSTDATGGNLVLEYNGNGLVSSSYSGSIPDPYDTYGTLKWIPSEGDSPNFSASAYLPFFNGDWWSVQMNVNGSTGPSLTGDTDVYAMIDFTSGAYSYTSNSFGSANRSILYDAISEWFINYKTANPGYTGKLHIGIPGNPNTPSINITERYIAQFNLLMNTNNIYRTNSIANTLSPGLTANGVWVGSDSSGAYSWTTDGIPTDWDNSNYVPPNRVFILSFTNEVVSDYHTSAASFIDQPKPDYIEDFNLFTGSVESMDYFGGILYPVLGSNTGGINGAALGMSLHSYGAIENVEEIDSTSFLTAFGTTIYNAILSSGGSFPFTNPYYSITPANSKTLSQYGWEGVYNRNLAGGGGSITFTAAEFASDINAVLDNPEGSSSPTASLYVANKIDGRIGFNESSSIVGFDDSFYYSATKGFLNKDTNVVFTDGTVYTPFSGSFQELRYYVQEISQSKFLDYTVNPYSNEGNSTHPTDIVGSSTIFSNDLPNQQFFRADLGTQLNTSSRTSIHPRVTGSAVQITQSFATNSEFYINSSRFVTNVEDIFQDQVPVGIKNRITDKIQTEKIILAEAPYGFTNPTSSLPVISSENNDTQTLSPMESMQVTSFTSQSYTPNVNYLEVAFSPSNQINDDINAQLGYFNLGEFIGDPRFVSSSLYTYPDLDRLRNSYFEKYMDSYDVVDFIRLIKFFDNSLFKMIKDFTPARTSLSSGVVVKQHILERNRQRPAQATSSLHDYEGLVVNLPKDYSSGSSDFPQYSTEGSAIYKFSGGTGGSFERFNGLQTYGITKWGQLLGRDGGGFGSGTNLMTKIITDTLDTGTGVNQQYPNIPAAVIKGNGYYPVNIEDENYSLGEIRVDVNIKVGDLFGLSVFITTPNNIRLSAGNKITINSLDLDPIFSGEIVVELIEQQIVGAPDWNATIPYNRFGVTQSWQDGNDGSVLNTTNFNQSSSQFISGSYLGPRKFPKDNQSEFYDGIFSGSMIIVATQSLNPGCDPYLNANDTPVVYKPIFFPLDFQFDGVVSEGGFNNQLNAPPDGYAWISSKQTNQGNVGIQQVQAIKLSQNDVSGVEVINYLDDFENLRILFTLPPGKLPYGATATEYFITGRTVFADHIILQVSQTQGNNFFQFVTQGAISAPYYPITSSEDGGSMQWSLDTKTDYITALSISESIDDLQQGVFLNPNTLSQEQNFYYWNNFSANINQDALGFFNPGSENFTTFRIFNLNTRYENGAYTIPYTPNIPWHLEFTVKYSASLNTNASGIVENEGIYHQGNNYEGASTLVSQTFFLNTNQTKGFYVKSDLAGYNSAALAAASADPTSGDNIIYYSNASSFFPLSPETPVLYSDSTLSTLATSLTLNKYYKFSNLDTTATGQDYFVVRISYNSNVQPIGSLQTGNRNPASGKTATLSLIDIAAEGFYRPAPKSTTGLGTVLFNGNNFNTQIPGNSGSGTPVTDNSPFAGHPKIKVPTTNSMFITDLDLQLGGVPPTLGGGGGASFVPFSGSDANSNNTDFDLQFSAISKYTPTFLNQTAIPAIGVPNMGQTYDGSIFIQWTGTGGVGRAIQEGLGGNASNFNKFKNIDFNVSCIIQSQGVSADFNVQLVEQRYYTSPVGLDSTINVLHTFNSDSSGKAELSNESIQLSSLFNAVVIPPPGVGNYNSRIYFLIKNNEGSAFDYSFQLGTMGVVIYYANTQDTIFQYPATGNPTQFAEGDYSNPTDGFQNGTTNEALTTGTSDFYNECVVNAYLKRTGSQGDFIITSSIFDQATGLGGFSGSIFSGSTITFTDTPIRAFKDVDFSTDTTSTYANPGDIYYLEYEFKDLKVGQIGGNTLTGQQFDFKTSDGSLINSPKVEITASGDGGSANFGITSSILLRRSNLIPEPENTGEEMLSLEFLRTNTFSSTGTATVTGKYPGQFNANDIHRFSVQVEKDGPGTGLVIQEFSASIYPSQSLFSPLPTPYSPAFDNFRNPQNTDFIVPTYYAGALPFNLALDCQPMLNNFILQRQSEYIMDVDYNNQSGSIIPVNQEQILDNEAVKAAVPDSNYTALSSINPRYDGVKSTSAKLNVWSVGDFGTYGKTPTVELRDAYFGYFNDLSDPYPNINALTQVNLSYLIDEQGNALPPSLNNKLSIDTFKQVFPNTTLGKLAIKDGNNRYTPFSTPSSISRIMEYVTPICYSQNSGNNYSKSIPLSGSGYISRYDNDDENSIDFAQFSVAGTSSIVNVVGQDKQTISYYIDPSETNAAPVGATTPYSVATLTGSASYPTSTWGGSDGESLNNQQIVSIQHSVVTTFVSETSGTGQELDLRFKMFTGSNEDSQSPFNLESIDCKVYTETGQVYLLRDVDNYGWFRYENLPTTQVIAVRETDYLLNGFNRWSYTRVPIPGGGIHATADWEMYNTLFDLGLMRERSPRNGSGVIALEWIFKANSGNIDIKQGEKISWKIEGFFKDARGGFQQGFFFPNAYTGAYTPAMIKGMGALDYKLEEANNAVAPFWTFSGSATSLSTDLSIIEMSSSNFNEAYGTGFFQGNLPYEPGFSEYFPGNIEPKTTDFDKIENPIEFLEGDEIRFGNNENFTYRVLEVFAPSENVSSSAAGNFAKVKLRLDKPVDASINKDFFLIRRPITTPQSLYLDAPFPYGILSSGSISTKIKSTGSIKFGLTSSAATGNFPSPDATGLYTASISEVEALSTPGILYPDFPTEYLIQSASIIVNDLISKGVIES